MELSNQDWKLYRQMLPLWQEAYMEQLLEEYRVLLSEDVPAARRFWDLKQRIEQDAHHPGVCVSTRRGNAVYDIAKMLADGVISPDDLRGFSDDLKTAAGFLCQTNL